MPCYEPLEAYWSKDVNPSGKRGITFNRNASFSGIPFKLPCQQCIGCRLARSLQWGVRMMHEAQLHSENTFLTLTYDDDHLPKDWSLSVRDHQLFMKRLKKKLKGASIRFYMSGEYGETTRRPHYHYVLFGLDFADKKFYKRSKNGLTLYNSALVSDCWPFGYNVIGDVTLESCCYVSRYVVDKITGEMASAHYETIDRDGVLHRLVPEFSCMSRRPGIAADWYAKYGKHSHLSGDFAVLNGKRVRMPRFYDNRFEVLDPKRLEVLKRRRRRNALTHRADNVPARLRVRHEVALRNARIFKRDVD